MKTINKVVEEIVDNPLIAEMTNRYKNTLELSGLILRKPKIIKHDKTGVESCSFILFHFNNKKNYLILDSFSCITYDKDVIEQFKTLDKVICVATIGKVRYSKSIGGLYSQVHDIKTLFELDIGLADEWEKKKDDK